MNVVSLVLLSLSAGATEPAPIEVALNPASRPIVPTALHFGANVEYHAPGIFYGTLPVSDPRSRREAFAQVIKRSGLRSLRFPGGNCSYWYLYDSEEATRKLTAALEPGIYAPQNFQNQFFTQLDHFLDFCREHDVEPIIQLPTMFYNDGGQPRGILPGAYSERFPGFLDRDRVAEAAAYVGAMAAMTKERGFDVTHWEIGNEDFGFYEAGAFARITVAFAEAIHDVYPEAHVYVTMMHWANEFMPLLREAGLGGPRFHFTTHYPFGSWYLAGKDVDTTDPVNYVMADMGYEKNYRTPDGGMTDRGWPEAKLAATETATIRFPQPGEHSWDPHAIIPSYAHALAFAYNWSVLISRPACNVATFHDLESTYFGLIKFGVYRDPDHKRFNWIPPDMPERPERVPAEHWYEDEYLVGPSALAMGLLAELEGNALMEVTCEDPSYASHALHVIAGTTEDALTIVALNRTEASQSIRLALAPEIVVPSHFSVRTLTGDGLRSVHPHEFRIDDSTLTGNTVELAPYSVSLIQGARGAALSE